MPPLRFTHSYIYLTFQMLWFWLMAHCTTPTMTTWLSTLRVSALRLLMKYVCFLLKSFLRSRTTWTFTLNMSATSCPVLLPVANIFTTLTRSVTSSWRSVRFFLFGHIWLLCEWASWSACVSDSVVHLCNRWCDKSSTLAITSLEAALSCFALLLKAFLIFVADLAYSSSYSWLSRWRLTVNSCSIPLKDSGSKSSATLSRTESLRTYFRTLSALISYSTSKTVTRWLAASITFFTRVHNIGVSNMPFYFDGKYTDSSSEADWESDSDTFLRLKNFDRIDCFMLIMLMVG